MTAPAKTKNLPNNPLGSSMFGGAMSIPKLKNTFPPADVTFATSAGGFFFYTKARENPTDRRKNHGIIRKTI